MKKLSEPTELERALQDFAGAAVELARLWQLQQSNHGTEPNLGYPFETSFDEVAHQILTWRDMSAPTQDERAQRKAELETEIIKRGYRFDYSYDEIQVLDPSTGEPIDSAKLPDADALLFDTLWHVVYEGEEEDDSASIS